MIKRIDVMMTEKGLAKSRTAAQQLIYEGSVSVNAHKVSRPSEMFEEDKVQIEISEDSEVSKYVSRGGLKLETAIDSFGITLDGLVCLDIGASTGGFTDCLLRHGAAKVYAVDVGTSQLVPKLKADERVVSLEKLDIRKADDDAIPEKADFVTIDVSFISLRLILPEVFRFAKEGAGCVALIKPQFEVGRAFIGRSGVVKDAKLRAKVVAEICDFAQSIGFDETQTVPSKITGGDGNEEYLMYCRI